MEIRKPIFINGCPRSGTTMLAELLCSHPDVGWFSNYTNIFPSLPQLAIISRVRTLQHPNLSKKLGKLQPYPTEAWNIWKHCCSNKFLFSPLDETDVTEKNIRCLKKTIDKHVLYQKKKRFMTKITGPPKIRYLNKVFPDSMFVYIIRDGRGVTNSLLNVPFWKRGKGYDTPWWGQLPQQFEEEWLKYHKSSVILAAVQWKYMLTLFLEEKKAIDVSRCCIVKYEDICNDPYTSIRKIVTFCELEWNKDFEKFIKSFKVKNMNYKWKEKIPKDQQSDLNAVLREYLERFDYELDSTT